MVETRAICQDCGREISSNESYCNCRIERKLQALADTPSTRHIERPPRVLTVDADSSGNNSQPSEFLDEMVSILKEPIKKPRCRRCEGHHNKWEPHVLPPTPISGRHTFEWAWVEYYGSRGYVYRCTDEGCGLFVKTDSNGRIFRAGRHWMTTAKWRRLTKVCKFCGEGYGVCRWCAMSPDKCHVWEDRKLYASS